MESTGDQSAEMQKGKGQSDPTPESDGISAGTKKAGKPANSWKSRAIAFLLALILSFAFLTFPRQPYALDDSLSEKVVLNYAHEKGLQFGKDIVFTYGPLGFLTSRYFFPHAAEVRFGTDLLFCAIVAAGICALAWRLTALWRSLLLVLFVWFAANLDPRSDLLIYSGMFGWGMVCIVATGAELAIGCLGFILLAAFGILVKGNFIIVAGLSLLILACDLLLRAQWQAAIGLLFGTVGIFILGWVAARQGISNIPAFFATGFSIIRGYDQAVGLIGLEALRTRGGLTLCFALGSALIASLSSFDARTRFLRLRRALLAFWFCSLLFMIWKHSFVRSDLYHMGYFFGFAPIAAISFALLPCEQTFPRWLARGLGLACCAIAVLAVESFFLLNWKSSLGQPLLAARENFMTLLRPSVYREKETAELEAARHSTELPALRGSVGTSSVDVFGQDQCCAVFNGMNYHPRPIFQSYMAYNETLMRLNEAFYLSSGAPDFVLFALRPVDRKFPPLEDAMVLRDLLFNYEAAAEESSFLLLKKKFSDAPKLSPLREGALRFGEQITLKEFGETNIWMELKVQPTLTGDARELLFKPPKLRLAIQHGYTTVHTSRFPAPAPMLAAGFVASPLLLTNRNVMDFYERKPVVRPQSYAVEPLAGTEKFWQPTMHYRIYSIENR